MNHNGRLHHIQDLITLINLFKVIISYFINTTIIMNKTCIEYVWIDKNGHYRSKCKIVDKNIENIRQVDIWNFDGSSTGQNTSIEDTEIYLNPIRLFNDPFRGDEHKMVLCECLDRHYKPISSNHYSKASNIFKKMTNLEPWFGMEQEYFIIDPKTDLPIGFQSVVEQGNHYCGSGSFNVFGRQFAEYHLRSCLYANVNICGINAEVAPGQWEFQIGICEGIEMGDHLHMARYILYRCAEMCNIKVTLEPKPLKGNNWNGSGCHTNFSTIKMRNGTQKNAGVYFIKKAIKKLHANHDKHMAQYGTGNEYRMSGQCETAKFDEFTWSIGGRNVSVRVTNETVLYKKGYFEDRRPSSNCDPYLVSSLIFETCCLNK